MSAEGSASWSGDGRSNLFYLGGEWIDPEKNKDVMFSLMYDRKQTWWSPEAHQTLGTKWVHIPVSEATWSNYGTIANTSLVLVAVAIIPAILNGLSKRYFKGKSYSRSGISGIISTLVAILTGTSGLIAVTQNCFEALMACLGFAMVFVVSSFFFIFYNFLSCAAELGSNCLTMLCCQCCSKLQENVLLMLFFSMGIVWAISVLVLDVILFEKGLPFLLTENDPNNNMY